ncbi:helix-turn-helix transcriptional regulator [Nocardiopsis sp. RSe5-2]|uniref:Helix-turn-helix transcriptional regulator n=1 Tax=Nocardiopsis endophytica TaxID=3018445 RepID=A0ABT4UCE5_9ACTN|nr:helix-turn-helix transcriptional regulator [Nocardiopsis endophytica]MDA2814144.1 helix-turn-helix transcriptional regulator [Nocardiopsis endophytica]
MVGKNSARWARVGRQIHAEREKVGIPLKDLAEATGISAAMLSAMERGKRGIKRSHVVKIDAALGTKKILEGVWDGSAESDLLPPWFQQAAQRERAATEIRQYSLTVVPGLVQTEDYMRTLLRSGLPNAPTAKLEELVQARRTRQRLLEGEVPPRLLLILDETVLRRPVGGRAIMRNQLDRLVEVADWPYVSVQVVPFATEHHPGLSNGFVLYRVDGGYLLWLETRRSGTGSQDAEAVDDYLRLFGDLQGAALPAAASLKLIKEIRGEFE